MYLKLLFYCKLFTYVINRLLVYLKHNEWMNVLAGWGVNQKALWCCCREISWNLWNVRYKCGYILCIWLQTKTSVFFISFHTCCYETSCDKFMTVIPHIARLDVYESITHMSHMGQCVNWCYSLLSCRRMKVCLCEQEWLWRWLKTPEYNF